MADVKPLANPLFLREEELRQGIEMLFFAYRDFTAEADAILAQYGFGRAHHRVIYFVGRNPGMTVSELLVDPEDHQAEPEPRAEPAGAQGPDHPAARPARPAPAAAGADDRRAPIWSAG